MLRIVLYNLVRWICATLGAIYFRYRMARAGRANQMPKAGGAVFVSNHQSYLDPIFLGTAMPRTFSFMTRDNLFGVPFIGWFIRTVGAYPIQRAAADLGAIKETMRRLRNGEPVLVFPEGTRTEDGNLGPLLAGALLPAKKCRVPVIPMAVEGAFQCWSKGQRLPSAGNVRVIWGRPIPPERVAAMTTEEFLTEVRARLLELQAELRRGN